MHSFVLKFSGGATGHLLKSVETFIRSAAPAATLVPPVYTALGADCAGHDQKVLTRLALLKSAMLTCPNSCITVSNVRTLLGDKEGTADKHMKIMRKLLEDHAAEPEVQQFIERADTKIVGQLLAKKELLEEPSKTVEGLMYAMLTEIAEKMNISVDRKAYEEKKEEPKTKPSAKKSKSSGSGVILALLMYA